MNDQPDGNREVLPVAELNRIDHACEQFRAAWEAGQRPRIEDFLAAASGEGRAELLQRLVAQELTCRSRSGETPTPEEYEQRFPADASTVRQAFSRSPRSPSDRSEHSTHSNQNAALAETETQPWEGPSAPATWHARAARTHRPIQGDRHPGAWWLRHRLPRSRRGTPAGRGHQGLAPGPVCRGRGMSSVCCRRLVTSPAWRSTRRLWACTTWGVRKTAAPLSCSSTSKVTRWSRN